MLNYQKKDAGLYVPSSTKQNKKYKNCKECGKIIDDKSKTRPFIYCESCRKKHRKETYIKYNKKR